MQLCSCPQLRRVEMIRIFLSGIVLIIFIIISLPLLIVNQIFFIFKKKNIGGFFNSIPALMLSLFGFLSGARVEYIDFNKIPENTPSLFVLNHQSIFDIILTYNKWQNYASYIAKIELTRYPLFAKWLEIAGCLFIDRKDLKQGMKIIIEAINRIKAGKSIAVFPEGTINKTGHPEILQEFKSGSLKIADKAKCPLIPVVIANSSSIFEAQKPFIKGRCKVLIKCLDPIDIKSLSEENQKNLSAYVRNLMQNELTELYSSNFVKETIY